MKILPENEKEKAALSMLQDNTLYKDGAGEKYYSHNKARFMIGAMLTADLQSAESEGKKLSIGDALARFCSSNGPAWVKFGQALSNLPMLPPDIREPLSVFKDKAVSKPENSFENTEI